MNSFPAEICWDDLSFAYSTHAEQNTLEHVNLSVRADRFTVITGPSGCGKSTLLYLAAGIYPAYGGTVTGGKVTVNGTEPGSLSPETRAGLLCMMFQNPDLQFCMDTVEHELIFCMENISLPVAQMDERLVHALDLCGITHLRHRQLLSLSGGEKQRVMLACAVVLQPKWLLLDEPFANLDEASAADLTQKLLRLHREYGVGIVAVDHNPGLWRHAADDLIVLSADGSVSQAGPLLPMDFDLPYQEQKPKKVPGGSYAVVLQDLCVKKGGKPILQNLSACFEAGRIHAIVGPSGCGKSTLFSVLCGMEPYDGNIFVNGSSLHSKKRRSAGNAPGFVFQNPQDQFVADTVLEEITVSLRANRCKDIPAEAKRILKQIGLWRHRNLSPYMLSQGQQRRLGTAALLAYPCSILICDEPTYAQDRANVLAIMDLLQKRVVEDGLTLIFSTHDRLLAESYADHIHFMKEGKL